MAVVVRRVAGRDRRGVPFEMLVPAPIAGEAVPLRLMAAEAALRKLDAAARRPAGRPLVASLLATECLPGRDVMALAAGVDLAPSVDTDAAMGRFERACRDGARAEALDVAALRRAHRTILPGRGGGAIRTELVWIGAVPSPAQAVFVPPPPGELDGLLTDLAAFLARDDLCPVAQTVIAFAQLVLIHPFADGNGRLGRWLVQVNLRQRGVVDTLAPPLGLYLAANAGTFAAAHRAYRDGDLDTWCRFAQQALVAVATSARRILEAPPARSARLG
jgi:hypothetical protein